jgi:hypothetical protein
VPDGIEEPGPIFSQRRSEEFGGRQHGSLAWEDFVDEAGVRIGVEIGTAVFYYDEPVIGIGSVEPGRKDHAASGDAE